ncbi:MAG: S-adenosylmethionine:tRNA ribosyltransferase-isomerase, partial [bacterium]
GFHFTKDLIKKLKKQGIQFEYTTLQVGYGTFQPIKTEKVEDHQMHPEYVSINKETARRINQAKKENRRIIAVGTTTARALESLADQKGRLKAGNRYINIFIYPGYKFKIIDALITNFHLPQSTLLMLISALAGRKLILKAYQTAVRKKYRFYSFGDAMLIE